MAVNSFDSVTGRPIFVDTDAPDIKVDPTETAKYAADVGNRIIRANLAALDAYAYKRAGLRGEAADTGLEYRFNGTGWVRTQTSRLIGQWHKNIAGGSAGGQALGPSSSSYAIAAAPYARSIRVTVMGGVLPSAVGNGGVSVVPSTGVWAGGANEHRVNASPGVFTDLSYQWFMASLPAGTALTLTLTSQSSVTAGYDLHFTVEEF